MARLPLILICDDDPIFHQAVKQSLKGVAECRSAYHSDEAMAIVRNHPVELVLLDVQMRTPDEGLAAIPRLLEVDPELAIVMSSGRTDFQTVREAMRLGAIDYVAKDFEPQDLIHVIRRVLERRALIQRRDQQNFESVAVQRQHILVGEDPKVQALRRAIERIRLSPANVVITGETGTGKEVVARQLRAVLPDGSLAPFVAVDSATIQSSTAESQLFGHEKGAFTGAEKPNKGIFEEANGGIVYFDEIANMPLDIQAKLLRVIQEKEITRLGSSKVIPLDFRVVCATNRDLEDMVRQGQFKDDLLQRLNVLPIELPPLRERRGDISLLVRHFLKKQPGTSGNLTFTEEALELLTSYPWPGNIRELGNMIAYIVAMTDGAEVDVSDLPPRIRDAAMRGRSPGAPTPAQDGGTFYEQVLAFEKEILVRAYAKADRNVSRMAIDLGMDRSHLYTKLKEHGIHSPKKSER